MLDFLQNFNIFLISCSFRNIQASTDYIIINLAYSIILNL